MFETGVGIRNPLFFIGVIENNIDPRLEGRVQVRAFSIHGTNREVPAYQLPWAICVSGSYDPNTPPPPLNSFVYGVFLDGREAQHPLVLGLIPTQFAEQIDPETSGWGVIPGQDGSILAKGSAPRDFGQPQNSRLARGEDIHQTYVPIQEMNRVENVKIPQVDGEEAETWSEPEPAYAASYPYNRVIETANHSIEIDDTPGGERIMVWHRSGSYVQIDARGTTTHKSVSDKFEVNDINQHVYVGGRSMVYIDGDSYVKVGGNKIEEVEGDLEVRVHGNYLLGVGGQTNINSGDPLQMRGPDINIEANVSTMNIKAKKEIKVEADQDINFKANVIFNNALYGYEIFAATNISFTSLMDIDLHASNIFQTSTGLLPSIALSHPGETGLNIFSLTPAKITSTIAIDLLAPVVSADVIVNLSSGITLPALPAGIVIPGGGANETRMPEPPYKSTSLKDYKNYGSISSVGYISADDAADPSLINIQV